MTIPTARSPRTPLLLAVLAVSLGATLPAAAAAQPPPPHREAVNGRNLSRADFAQGRFEQESGGWTEFGAGGEPRFRFEETGRDDWSVYLLDRSRNFQIQLDVHRRMITLSANGGPRGDLYPITDMSSEPPFGAAIGPDPRRAGKPDDGPNSGADADGDDPDSGSDETPVGTFYRERGGAAVYFQFRERLHCVVQNPSQMVAFGGWEQVQTVPRLAMRGEDIGICAWPNGFYRRANDTAVYRLHGRAALNLGRLACHVVNPRQMELFGGFAQLRVVEASSNLFQSREQPGECADPRGAR
jgi:hypothetical protein